MKKPTANDLFKIRTSSQTGKFKYFVFPSGLRDLGLELKAYNFLNKDNLVVNQSEITWDTLGHHHDDTGKFVTYAEDGWDLVEFICNLEQLNPIIKSDTKKETCLHHWKKSYDFKNKNWCCLCGEYS